jgi:hypothetical protein
LTINYVSGFLLVLRFPPPTMELTAAIWSRYCWECRLTPYPYSVYNTIQIFCLVWLQKLWHFILQFTFFFSSKIIYVCKIGTYNADSHLIYLVEIKPQKKSVYSVSSIRRQSRKYPLKSNPNQIKPHPNVHKNVCIFNGFPSYHMAKVWSSYQTDDVAE